MHGLQHHHHCYRRSLSSPVTHVVTYVPAQVLDAEANRQASLSRGLWAHRAVARARAVLHDTRAGLMCNLQSRGSVVGVLFGVCDWQLNWACTMPLCIMGAQTLVICTSCFQQTWTRQVPIGCFVACHCLYEVQIMRRALLCVCIRCVSSAPHAQQTPHLHVMIGAALDTWEMRSSPLQSAPLHERQSRQLSLPRCVSPCQVTSGPQV